MLPLPLLLRATAVALVVLSVSRAQPVLPADPVALDSLQAFAAPTTGWSVGSDLTGDPRIDRTLASSAGTGLLVARPDGSVLRTAWAHGDLDLEFDYLLAVGADPEIRLQGRHALPLSAAGWTRRGPAVGAEAVRAPGLWQRVRLEYRAATETAPARLLRLSVNGFTVLENVELAPAGVVAEAPLEFVPQGGAFALRNLAVKRFRPEPVVVGDLQYRLYRGTFNQPGSYDDKKPDAEGVPNRFAHQAVAKSGRFALVFTGSITVPREGDYRFAIESRGPARLLIDGQPVVVPIERAGNQPGVVRLTAGRHEFRADLVHTAGSQPLFDVQIEGPGVAPQLLTGTAGTGGGGAAPKIIAVEPANGRIEVQRGFVPFEPYKRLYAVSVGTPAGVHYAYDFDTGSLLRVWSGPFLNTVDMWEGRGNDQLARARGPALTFGGKPTVGLLEYARSSGWPDRPEGLWVPKGYRTEADGQPVFLAELASLKVSDRIAPAPSGRGLTRSIRITGSLPSWSTWVLLAESDQITPRSGGWVIGDREWYLDWPADSAHRPVLRTIDGKQQLLVPITGAALDVPVNYTLAW